MLIDTVHQAQRSFVVITPTTGREHSLSDDAWRWVAHNQHRLLWADRTSGRAVLPKRVPVRGRDHASTVTRARVGERVTIELTAA